MSNFSNGYVPSRKDSLGVSMRFGHRTRKSGQIIEASAVDQVGGLDTDKALTFTESK